MSVKAVLALLLALSLALGCASSTQIITAPPDANVFINGEYIGRSPATHTDRKSNGAVNQVRVEKTGYEPFETSFTRDEKVNWWMLIPTLCLIVPIIWIMDYRPERMYLLRPLPQEAQAVPSEKEARLDLPEEEPLSK